MKQLSSISLIVLLIPIMSIAQSLDQLTGNWQGAFVRKNSIQQVEITLKTESDYLVGTYSIPEMGLYDVPIRDVAVSESAISLRFLYGPYRLKRHVNIGQMTAINQKWNPPVSLHLKKVSMPSVRTFESEELTFYNDKIKLAGTLMKPIGVGPFPAVVLVHGNGDQGREIWEYRSHGYALAKKGIAVLLYDKRGVGKSTGDYKTVNFKTLAEDAIAGLKFLKERDDIINSAVGLLGISQGGWISAIATGMSESINFVAMLQGPAVSLQEQEFHRVKYSLEADGFAKSSVDSALAHTKNYFKYVNERAGWEKLESSSKAALSSSWAEYINTDSLKDDPDFDWWLNNAYDPKPDLESVRVPVLAIFGEIDTAVPVVENRPKMQKYLTKAGVNFEIAIIPGLHHSVTTYQGIHGGNNWDWPNAFWKWSRRPSELDEVLSKWVLSKTK